MKSTASLASHQFSFYQLSSFASGPRVCTSSSTSTIELAASLWVLMYAFTPSPKLSEFGQVNCCLGCITSEKPRKHRNPARRALGLLSLHHDYAVPGAVRSLDRQHNMRYTLLLSSTLSISLCLAVSPSPPLEQSLPLSQSPRSPPPSLSLPLSFSLWLSLSLSSQSRATDPLSGSKLSSSPREAQRQMLGWSRSAIVAASCNEHGKEQGSQTRLPWLSHS